MLEQFNKQCVETNAQKRMRSKQGKATKERNTNRGEENYLPENECRRSMAAGSQQLRHGAKIVGGFPAIQTETLWRIIAEHSRHSRFDKATV